MQALAQALAIYDQFDRATIPIKAWSLFIRTFVVAFLIYWLHLAYGLNDWLGSGGFHVVSPATRVFAPLPAPLPQILWALTFVGALLLAFQRTRVAGCLLAGAGFFYATLCDIPSAGALNMHFLFAFAVIFWSTSLPKARDGIMPAYAPFS